MNPNTPWEEGWTIWQKLRTAFDGGKPAYVYVEKNHNDNYIQLKAFIQEHFVSREEMKKGLEKFRLEMPAHECVLGYCPHFPRIEQNNEVLDAAIAVVERV